MPNYAHAVIYRIINKETNENLYIGSTTNYNKRMSQHKSCCNNPNTHGYNSPIYQYIRELGGWEFVKHVMIEEYSACQNKLQLIKKEQEHIDAFASSKNAIRSYRTEDQIKEQQKKYDDSRKEQKKAYHDSRKESRKDYDRLRYLTKKNEQTELVQSTTL